MNKHNDFFDKPLFTIPNYIYSLLLGGLYFLICNPLVILFYIITSIKPELFNFTLLFLSLITLGPSFSALYSTMSQLLHEKAISVSTIFFELYIKNFKDNIKLWLLELSIIILLIVDFQYFYLNMPQLGIHIVFLLLSVMIILLGFYAFPIKSRFEINLKDLILLSFYYSIKKLHVTALKVIVIVILYKLSTIIPQLLLVFYPSVLCIIFALYDKPMLNEIKVKVKVK